MKKDFEPTRDLQDERVDASVSNLNPIPPQTDQGISPQSLGSEAFRKDHGLKYAYLSGAMYRGIASKELVIAMGRAGFMGFLGTGGLSLDDIEKNIIAIQQSLCANHAYGMNLVCNIDHPATEMATVELYLQYGIKCVEAAAFIRITPALVLYRAKGLYRDPENRVCSKNKLIAKISRPEVASAFLSPAPQRLVQQLVNEGKLTPDQAQMSQLVPMSDDICVEADSGGHTDQGIDSVLLPAIQHLRDTLCRQHGFHHCPRIGLAGGIGTPTAAAAAFIMGADFIVSGSIDQCTVEAATSDLVKDMLQDINVQDTDYAPAGDMFEIGARAQVLKKGVLFPARANKLWQLYHRYDSIEDIPEKTQLQIQEKFFKKTFDDVWTETRQHLLFTNRPDEVDNAEQNSKAKMARIFRWYFAHSMQLAFAGNHNERVNFQVHTGPALGAFNQWVKGTPLESWQNRHVAEIGEKIMRDTADLLTQKTRQLLAFNQRTPPRQWRPKVTQYSQSRHLG